MEVSSPHASRARNAAPSAPPSGTSHTCTGSSVQSASASTQPVEPRPATGRDDAAGRNRARVDHAPGRERGRLERGSTRGRGTVGEIEIDELPAAVGILQRHPLTTRVRNPHRYARRIDGFGAGAEQPASPS